MNEIAQVLVIYEIRMGLNGMQLVAPVDRDTFKPLFEDYYQTEQEALMGLRERGVPGGIYHIMPVAVAIAAETAEDATT